MSSNTSRSRVVGLLRTARRYSDLYLLSLPGLIFLALFRYAPMYGASIAFKDYNIIKGIIGSDWVGFAHFRELFSTSDFPIAVRNTVIISLLQLGFQFPTPLIFALLLNEVRNLFFRRAVQTISYVPHFISWVVISGICIDLLSPSSGLVNTAFRALGIEPVYFMADKRYFRTVLVVSFAWKEMGWQAIIYLAAITQIDPDLYQAATVDGANRWRQTWHVTLPSIRGTFVVLLILRIGHMMSAGMDQILMMYNPMVYEVADIIDTYVYRVAFGRFELGLTAAAGLFKSVIACGLLLFADRLAKALGEPGIY